MSVHLTLDEVHDFARAAFLGAGASEHVAEVMAGSIREGEAEGIRNVALAYLPTHLECVRTGAVDGRAEPTVESPTSVAVRADAADGFPHPAFLAAESTVVDAARTHGLAILALTRSSSACIVGWFFDRFARAGLVSMGFANASPLVALHGTGDAFFGTNPMGYGVPRRDAPPVICDMSTSATAYVNIMHAAARGEPIPPHWGVDGAGHPTTNAQEVIDRGAVAPSGGYKGMALGLWVDVMAAALTGSRFSFETPDLFRADGGHFGLGQVFLALDPGRLGAHDFGDRLEVLLAAMTSHEGVRLPGDSRHASRERTSTDGVTLSQELFDQISAYAG